MQRWGDAGLLPNQLALKDCVTKRRGPSLNTDFSSARHVLCFVSRHDSLHKAAMPLLAGLALVLSFGDAHGAIVDATGGFVRVEQRALRLAWEQLSAKHAELFAIRGQ